MSMATMMVVAVDTPCLKRSCMRLRLRKVIGASALLCTAFGTTPAVAVEPVTIRAETLSEVRTINERFMSFQIGMSHLTGGETWKSYDSLPKGQGPTAPGTVDAVREVRQA